MGRMEDHCLALLCWACTGDAKQHHSAPEVARLCGIPCGTLKVIIATHRHHGGRTCWLCNAARKYRYNFKVFPHGSGRLIEAIHLGYTYEAFCEMEMGDNQDGYR